MPPKKRRLTSEQEALRDALIDMGKDATFAAEAAEMGLDQELAFDYCTDPRTRAEQRSSHSAALRAEKQREGMRSRGAKAAAASLNRPLAVREAPAELLGNPGMGRNSSMAIVGARALRARSWAISTRKTSRSRAERRRRSSSNIRRRRNTRHHRSSSHHSSSSYRSSSRRLMAQRKSVVALKSTPGRWRRLAAEEPRERVSATIAALHDILGHLLPSDRAEVLRRLQAAPAPGPAPPPSADPPSRPSPLDAAEAVGATPFSSAAAASSAASAPATSVTSSAIAASEDAASASSSSAAAIAAGTAVSAVSAVSAAAASSSAGVASSQTSRSALGGSPRKRPLADDSSELGERAAHGDSDFTFICYVKDLESKTTTISVGESDTIAMIKSQLSTKLGIAAADQRLVFSGQQLKDDKYASEYNIQKESTLHLIGKGRGNHAPSQRPGEAEDCSHVSIVSAQPPSLRVQKTTGQQEFDWSDGWAVAENLDIGATQQWYRNFRKHTTFEDWRGR